MSKEIDWSKAPEGAKGHGYVGLSDLPIWVGEDWYEHARDDGGRYFFSTGEDGVFAWQRGQVKNYVDRPSQAWTGQGLPPVGTVCEFMWNYLASGSEYVTARVIAHYEKKAVVRIVSGEHGGSLRESSGGNFGDSRHEQPIFRPIRTQAQIEEEERKHAIDAMSDATQGAHNWLEAFGKLHDAGYRRAEVK